MALTRKDRTAINAAVNQVIDWRTVLRDAKQGKSNVIVTLDGQDISGVLLANLEQMFEMINAFMYPPEEVSK